VKSSTWKSLSPRGLGQVEATCIYLVWGKPGKGLMGALLIVESHVGADASPGLRHALVGFVHGLHPLACPLIECCRGVGVQEEVSRSDERDRMRRNKLCQVTLGDAKRVNSDEKG
jgi:hypothetical protein